MSESKSRQLPPAYQIGICLVLIVVVRLYYAWIESQTYWLFPRLADSPRALCAVYLGLVPAVSWLTAIAAFRYFSPVLTIPFAAVGGGTAGLIINSIPGAMIGAGIGLMVYSSTLRRWLAMAGRFSLQFALPAMLWGAWLGSLATSLFVGRSDQSTMIRVGLFIIFFVGVAILLYLAFRAYREQRGKLVQAIVGCVIASGLGMAIGPIANTLYRIYALNQVGDVSWDPIPRFNGTGNSIWEIYGVVLKDETTDAHLRLLPGVPAVTSLFISNADVSDETLAEALENLPDLELLEIRDIPVGDRALAPLKAAGRLIHLRLIKTSITDETFANLAAIPSLQILHVDGITLKGRGLRTLAQSGRLRYVGLENAAVTDADLADLNGLQGLTSLRLVGTEITGSGLKHLAKLPSLNNLYLSDSPIEDHYLADLNPTTLKFLSLQGIPLSDAGATAIASMTGLQGLSARRADLTDAQVAILSRLPPATHMVLDGSKLTKNSTDKLASKDVSIQLDNARITADDVERLISIGYDVRLTDCRFDEASLQRLAEHRSTPDFIVLVQGLDKQLSKQLSKRLRGGSVQVSRYWPD